MNIILLFAPVAIGGILAAINADGLNETTERIEAWTRQRQQRSSSSTGSFSKYVANPLLWSVVRFYDWTDGFSHRGLKNGTRVAVTLYLIAAWLFILYSAVKIAIMLVVGAALLYVIVKILVHSNDDVRQGYNRARRAFDADTPREESDVLGQVGLRGKKVYSGTNWFNEELKGRVDDDGIIYKGTNWFNEERIGRIDDDGDILRGTNFLNEEKVGRIDRDGNLHKGTNWFNEEKTGRIDEDGNVHEGTNWFNEEKKGRTGD